MTEQQYPPPGEGQIPLNNLVPPKPQASEQPLVPVQQNYYGQQQGQQPMQQPGQLPGQQPMQQPGQLPSNPADMVRSDQVYPTPPRELVQVPLQYNYPQGQQPYVQQPYQQQSQGYQQAPQQPHAQQPYQQQVPPSQLYQQPSQQYYPPEQQWQQQGAQMPATNNYATFLTLSILAAVLCAWPFAIPAIYYAMGMNTAYKQGNAFGYNRAKKRSRTWLIVSVSVAVVLYFFIFAVIGIENVARLYRTY